MTKVRKSIRKPKKRGGKKGKKGGRRYKKRNSFSIGEDYEDYGDDYSY